MGMDSKKREPINHVAQSISRTKTKKRFENVGYKKVQDERNSGYLPLAPSTIKEE